MTTDADAWLEENTFECKDLNARVSVAQCWSNRAKAKEAEYPGMVRFCLECEHGFGQNRSKNSEETAMTKVAKVKRPYNRKAAPVTDVPQKQPPVVAAASEVMPSALGGALQKKENRSLLYFLEKPVTSPGFFLDFTGQENLLVQVEELTDDINSDLLILLTYLLDRKLCEVAG